MGALRILFVCTGNLCRSPMAQAVGLGLSRSAGLAVRLEFDSAGTQALQGRATTDPRALAALRRAGYAFGGRRARRVMPRDFAVNDLVLAMDAGHLEALRDAGGPKNASKVRLSFSTLHRG